MADPVGGDVAVFAAGGNGAPNPTATITGPDTGLTYPTGVALDASGNIYVANAGSSSGGSDSVFVFPPGSNGDAVPSATITGSATGLAFPAAITLDSAGNIYVANQGSVIGGSDSITIYAVGSSGNVAPINSITGPDTILHNPAAITLDSSGDIWIANTDFFAGDQQGSIAMYPTGASGDHPPTVAIYGSCSGMDAPDGVAVDASGNIYVSDSGELFSDSNISIFPAGSNGCATASAVIEGAATTLVQPAGLTIDSNLNVYVADYFGFSLDTFAAGSNGNGAPSAQIAEPNTGMDYPMAVAVNSNGKIYVANAGSLDGGSDSITVYPAGSNANVTPSATIGANGATPDNTGLNMPDAIAVPSSGGIWIANAMGGADGNGSIEEFGTLANGNVAPLRAISGANTGLEFPVGIAVISNTGVIVLNQMGGPDGMGSTTNFLLSDNGNVTPIAGIAGTATSDKTGFNYPSGLALDSNYNLYVTNDGSVAGGEDSVTIYASGSNGNVAPTATITGPDTQLDLPSGIAVDTSGNIYVANDGSLGGGADTITVYPPGSTGDAAPSAVISGLLTDLSQPNGIALGIE